MTINQSVLSAHTEHGTYFNLCMMHTCDSFMLWRALPGEPQEQFIKITDPAVAVLVFLCFTQEQEEI